MGVCIHERSDGVMKSAMKAVLMLSVLAFSATAVMAMEKDGVEYPDQITVDGVDLVLNGLGTREATIFKVNVYVAALYLENLSSDGYAICESEETKRLILHFVRDVGEGDITGAWTEGFVKNAGDDLLTFQDRIETLNSWMSDINDGERMVYTYIPGTGLEVSVSGDLKGVIEGADFASAFFSIWLGDNPPNGGLRDGLLGD